MAWHRHAIRWSAWTSAVLAVLALAGLVTLLVWAAKVYTPGHPLNLSGYLPKIEHYFAKRGLDVRASKLELFYDGSLVVRIRDLALYGADGKMSVYVEQAAAKLANHDLLLLQAVPKTIEAEGVTLRLERKKDEGLHLAGMDLAGIKPGEGNGGGLVGWLNGLGGDMTWHRLKGLRIGNVTVLARDDVKQTEWVLENGSLNVSRYPDDGERGTMHASLRRLYGPVQLKDQRLAESMAMGKGVPVVMEFRHKPGAGYMHVRGVMDDADTALVSDYMPPEFADLIAAKGQIGISTRLLPGNRLDKPFVTMDLKDVSVNPPKGYSKPMTFPALTLTAMYEPPVQGVSSSDILMLNDVSFTTARGVAWQVSGTISNLTTDPLIDMHAYSPAGPVQGVFDFFPDQPRGFAHALEWLRPNIRSGDYSGLVAYYSGRPSAFPDCGDKCGVFRIDAKVGKGEVKFLPEMSPVVTDEGGTFTWRGQAFTVDVPGGTLADQRVSHTTVTLDNLFSRLPSRVRVSGTLSGPLQGVLKQLDNIDELRGHLPMESTGTQTSHLDIYVPLEHGKKATFMTSTVVVSGKVSNLVLKGLPELEGAEFTADSADVDLLADKHLQVRASGRLNKDPLGITWIQDVTPGKPSLIGLSARGTVQGQWLMAKAKHPEGVVLEGPVRISSTMQEGPVDTWTFNVDADASRAKVEVKQLDFSKGAGVAMDVAANGVFGPHNKIVLKSLDVRGEDMAVAGNLTWDGAKPNATVAHLNPLRLGKTNVTVNYDGGVAKVSGSVLDISGFDIFGKHAQNGPDTLGLTLNVGQLLTKDGSIQDIVGDLDSKNGVWTVRKLTGHAGKNGAVDIAMVKGKDSRQKLTVNVQDLGTVLKTLGIYDKLKGGTLSGEINYDSPNVGGGLLKIDNFGLNNPPTLMQLLSLLSLEQIVAGTDSILFEQALLPVRVDGKTWTFDNATMEGPSMSIRFDGTYMGDRNELNIDGQLAPALPLNRLVAKIPLLGRLLTGSQDALVVADFKLKGPTDNPDVHVRPLSVITPGLLKDVWRGMTSGGDAKKPAAPLVSPSVPAERKD